MNAHVSDGDTQVRQGAYKPWAWLTPVLLPSPLNPPPTGCTVVRLAVGQPDHCLTCVLPTEAYRHCCAFMRWLGVAWVGGNE